MPPQHVIIGMLVLGGLGLWALFVVAIERLVLPRLARFCGDDPQVGLARLLVLAYSRTLHRVRIEGAEQLRATARPGALLVVANHTAGVDPLLIQSGCRFFIRWMMAEDMMVDSMSDLWRWIDVIPVNRETGDSAALRTAIRHLREEGVIGLFPEGGIERPRETIAPFMSGVGLLAKRTGAPILLVWIGGTPDAPSAFGSLLRPSASRLRCELIAPYPADRPAEAIALELRRRLATISGWPLAETPLIGDSAADNILPTPLPMSARRR